MTTTHFHRFIILGYRCRRILDRQRTTRDELCSNPDGYLLCIRPSVRGWALSTGGCSAMNFIICSQSFFLSTSSLSLLCPASSVASIYLRTDSVESSLQNFTLQAEVLKKLKVVSIGSNGCFRAHQSSNMRILEMPAPFIVSSK
ncbi:hypothetical protein MHYP_G00269980 [Metynnis hypsauchen]